MSLLNNMLNDIEKRRVIAGAGQPLADGGMLSQAPRSAAQRAMIPLILVAVGAGAGVWMWSQYRDTHADSPVPRVVTTNRVPAVSPALAKPAAVTENAAPPAAPTSVAAAAPEPVAAPSAVSSPPEQVAAETQPVVADRKEPARANIASAAPAEAKKTIAKTQHKPIVVTMASETASSDPAKPVLQTIASADPPPAIKIVRPEQKSDNFLRQALSLLQESKIPEAQRALRKSLAANQNNHRARRLLVESLIDAGNNAEAVSLLNDGLDLTPGYPDFLLTLAHLQAADGNVEEAIATLEQGLHNVGDGAEYHAFLAALLQKEGRHADAIQHYVVALRSAPSMPSWLIGVGISLQAQDQMNDAAEAYQRAIDTGELSLEVAQFADRQLKLIRQPH